MNEVTEIAETLSAVDIINDINKISNWVIRAEKELDEQGNNALTFHVFANASLSTTYKSHILSPENDHMRVRLRLSKYYTKMVRERIRAVKMQRKELFAQLIELDEI